MNTNKKTKILLTGATGYIGKRILPVLVDKGYFVICCVRDADRFNPPSSLRDNISVIEIDLLDKNSLEKIPQDISAAYYLVHSMSSSKNYETLEYKSAFNFMKALEKTSVIHVIYLGGIINEKKLSKHLKSRKNVEEVLKLGKYNFTSLRAGIIIGSGSASFEIIRDIVEKLPLMIAPQWLKTKCQPIGISDVTKFLTESLFNKKTFNKVFDIGGPDILSYKEMLLQFAEVRNLKRSIFIIPVMSPRLSSYWLYFVTSTSYMLAVELVNSMKVEVVCKNNDLNSILNISPVNYKEAIRRAFEKIKTNEIISSWKDSQISGRLKFDISDFINVPVYGCFHDQRKKDCSSVEKCLDKIWQLGGEDGWYYAEFLWNLRGFIDKLFGGIGLRRGRTKDKELTAGDAVDFWRVLYADKSKGRLLLFAEMKLPGEAWLEFKVENNQLIQTATFRPKGIAGRLYWYLIYPFHGFVFTGMINKLTS